MMASARASEAEVTPTVRLLIAGAHPLAALELDDGIGLLHPAAGATGVVLFGSWSYEDIALRRTLRALGEALAAAGLPTLRFDLPGVADSLAETKPNRLADWVEAGRRAADRLTATCGCRELIFVGFGLGANLAARAAAGRRDVVGLCLAAPVQQGRRYLRETSTTARFMYDALGLPSPPRERLELAGESLPCSLTAEIGAIDLVDEIAKSDLAVPHGLILEREGAAVDRRLVEALSRGEAQVVVEPFVDHQTAASCGVAFGLPNDTIRRIARWAEGLIPATARTSAPALPPTGEPVRLAGDGFVETPVAVGSAGDLYGVLCRPAEGASRGPIVVFFNTNHDHHAGWGRTWVEVARALARAGHTSLRFDLPGIGDSPGRAGAPPIVIYSDHHIEAATDVVETLARTEKRDVLLVGLCSGAFIAFQTAVRAEAVVGMVLFNTLRFVWDPKESVLQAVAATTQSPSYYKHRVLLLSTYRRLLTGQVDLGNVVRSATDLLLRSTGMLHLIDRNLRTLRARLQENLQTLLRRKVVIRLANSEFDAAWVQLERYFGRRGWRLAIHPTVRIDTVVDTDHNMTSEAARRKLETVVIDVADALSADPGRRRPLLGGRDDR